MKIPTLCTERDQDTVKANPGRVIPNGFPPSVTLRQGVPSPGRICWRFHFLRNRYHSMGALHELFPAFIGHNHVTAPDKLDLLIR